MGKKDIEKHQFKKGQSGNPKGRPKRKINEILDELKEHGAEKVSKTMIIDVYETMLSLTQDELQNVALDKSKQMLLRVIAKAVLSKRGFEIVEQMLDRAHGKPTQTQTINQQTEIFSKGLTIQLPEPDDELKKKWEICKNNFDDD